MTDQDLASLRTGGAALLRALDRAVAIAEFAPDGRLLHANTNYLAILGYEDLAAVRGRPHSLFCPPEYAASADYQALWARLLKGEAFSGCAERRRADGRPTWLEATYAPVCDGDGRVARIVKIATDVSARICEEARAHEHTRRLSLVADATDNAVIIGDGQWRILYVNAGFTRMFGWTLEEAAGRAPIALLAPQMSAAFTEAFRAALQAGQPVRREEIVQGRDGQRYWASVLTNPVMAADGTLLNTVSVLTDITRAKMHEVLQHRVLEAMAREQPLADVLDLVCREVERIAPEICASILEVDDEGRLHPLAAPSLPPEYSKALDGVAIGPAVGSCGTAAWRGEAVVVTDIASDPLWAPYKDLILPLGYRACWSTPIHGADRRVSGTFAFYYRAPAEPDPFHRQLVEACVHLCALALDRERSRLRIRKLAFYDALTGLPNRSLLHAKADQAIAGAMRNGTPLAVLFIDLDRFKQVNDSLGHPAGDELLRHVARCLQAEVRGSDIAGRLSGDEFVVVLPQCDATQATDAVERLQAGLATACEVGGVTLRPSASVGIAMFPADGRDMETLLHRADMAMYQAKNGGRGRFSFFSSEMNVLAQERLALETALRDALRDGGLALHYQPQIDLKTGRIYGVEALARWHHARLGPVPPARFIPLAEECGLIGDLGRWALGEACRQLAEWRAGGLAVPAVSVNLSPTSFHNLDLPRMIADTLRTHSLAPHDLTLELTESVLLDTHPSTMKTIGEVHAQGVRLAMDDFGTGYSSLSYLRRLPVSELKLDQSFVHDLEHDETARALSQAVIRIGESLHLTVVAEGVETTHQHHLLTSQGCQVAQGYLFARPLPPAELKAWLDSETRLMPR
ncbi:GGDEF and EAL domain-containing protein [Aquincola sp. MAHUQ-54]|uniref:GGDEF and EAL domain-containing protein n=1 Tax=Aquincola agrisoli TaxID=3119538 RepID=A0AAW9QCT7_9BURK